MATTLIGGNETGLLDSTRLLLNRNDQAREGVLGHGEQSFINVANGNLVLQQRDVYMPSLGEDFGLVRTYNSRGVPSDAHQHEDARWTFSTFVRLNERHDGGTTYFEVEYGDGSTFEYRLNPNTGLYESVDGAGAFETLRDLGVNRPGIAAYELTRADQTKLSFDKQGHLLSSVDTNGVRMDYFYASDRLQQVRDDTGHTINYEYENGVLHRLTNETGLVLVEYRYTSGRLSEVIDRDGHSTKYFYTNDGFLNRIELPSAQDANGDGVPETFATRALLIDYEQVNWRGDQQGKAMVVTRVTDAEGGVTTFDYSFEFTTPGASQAGKGQFKRVDTTTTTYYAVNAAALTITQTGTRTVSVPAFYTVQAGDTWQSIATSLYGTPNAAAALQAALNNPALSAGAQLTGLPPSLSFTQTTTVSVPPYYTVQAGDTWASIAQAVYGTSDAEVIAALQSALGNPALVAGTQLIVPLELTYTPGSVTKNANPAALSNTITSTNTYNLNSGQLTTPTTSGWNVNATLVASSSTNATAPQIRYDQNGNGIAVWVLGNDLFWSRYTKSSDSWTAAAALDGTLTNAPSQPHLSISANGNALVTWVQNGNIYARRFIAGVWDGATTIPNLENLTGAARNPVGAINDAGRAVVSFVQVNGTVSNVYTNVFNGSAWQSAATAVDDIGTANANTIGATVVPSVAIDPSNNATVLWLQKTGTQTADSLYFSRFNPSTSVWSTPNSTTLENSTTAVTAAQIALDANGNGIALWLQGSTLFANSYTRSTDTWSSTATTLSTSASGLPQLSMSANGNALATWVSGTDILARRYAAGAWLGTGAEAVENATGAASSPVGSINDLGQAAVVFVQATGSTNNVLVNRFAGGAWQSATLIESSGNAVAATMTAGLAIDSNGNIGSVFLQKTGNGASATDGVFRNRYVSGDPYYTIPSNPSWSTIAQTLYGSSTAASALQSALGNPPLIAGNRLTGFPPTLTVTTTTTVAPYYTVQANDTWTSIAQAVYGDTAAAGPLQAALNNPTLTAGLRLTVPASLTYKPVVAATNSAALSTTETQTTNYSLNAAALTNSGSGWVGPVALESSTSGASNAQIQFDENGNGLSVWIQASDIVARRYDRASNTWASPVVLDSLASTPDSLDLYVDPSGNAIVTWAQNNGTANGVYARRYSAATNSWLGNAELLETNGGTFLSPVAAINASGQAIVVWTPTDGANVNLRASRYTGGAWSAPVTIDANSNQVTQPNIALDAAGNASVVWTQSSDPSSSQFDSVYLNRFDASAGAWAGASLVLENSTLSANNARIGFDQNGNGIATWYDDGNFQLVTRHYDKASNSWGPGSLNPLNTYLVAYDLKVDASGNAILVWEEEEGNVEFATYYVWARRYSAASGAWLNAELLSQSNFSDSSSPVAAINASGQAVVAWTEFTDASHWTVQAKRYTGAAWTDAIELSGNTSSPDSPQVTLDDAGNAGVVWRAWNGNYDVFLNRFSNAGASYTVQAGDTWASIAQLLYGTSAVANQLQQALGNPGLTVGSQLTGFPPTLAVNSTITVPPYYAVQAGDTWASIAQKVYLAGGSDAALALSDALGNPTLAAGMKLTMPASIRYAAPAYRSTSANNAVLSNTLTATTTQNLITSALTSPSTGVWGAAALVAGSSTVSAKGPQIKYDQNGNGMAVWAIDTDLFYSLYTKSTDSWSAAQTLDGSLTGSVSQPYLAMSANGNAVVTWSQNSNTVYARRYIAGVWDGATTIPVLVSGGAANPAAAAINDNGRAVVLSYRMLSVFAGISDLYASVFDGSSWTSTALDDMSGGNTNFPWNPSVAIDPLNNATVLWSQNPITGVSPLFLSRYTASTGTWSTPDNTLLDNTSAQAGETAIAFDSNGNGVATWTHDGTLLAKSYTRSTNAWSATATTLGTAASAINLSMSANGNGLVTWVSGNDVLARRYAGSAWIGTGPEAIESTAGAASNPIGAINDAGRAVITFAQANGAVNDVFVNRFAGGSWQGAVSIEANGNSIALPLAASVTIDPLGNIGTVWLQKNGAQTTDSVYRNQFKISTGTAPYYVVPDGATWDSVAQALYGYAEAGSALQSAMGNPPLVAGSQLTGFPPSLTFVATSTVAPYYTVQAGDTWASITQAVYGTNSASMVEALCYALGRPVLTAGTRLTVPQTLGCADTTVSLAANTAVLTTTETQLGTATAVLNASGLPTTKTISETVASYIVQAGDTWQSIASLLYGSVNVADELQLIFGNPALTAGRELTGFPLILSSTDPSTAATSTDKFFLGGTTRVVDALGNKRATSNDAEFQAWRVANGYYAVYDAANNSASFLAQVDAIRQAHSLTYIYPANGLITEAIDQQGLHTLYKYDGRENLIAVTDRNGWGAANSDAPDFRKLRADLGYVTTGGAGKLVADLTAAEREAILAKFTTTLTYDERGNLTGRIDPEGNRATVTYTAFNKLASETSAVGLALTTSDDPLYQQQRVALGFASLVANLSNADKLALLARNTTTFQYDVRQNLIQRTDAGGDITRYEYDANGNLTRRIVFLDKNDLVTPAKQQVTQYFYDQFGNNIETVDGEGNHTRSDYDIFGNLLRFIDGNGGITTFTYDNDNRLLTITDPEGHVTVNAYDAVGNRIAITDANGHTVTRLYDRNNMLLTVIDPSVVSPQDRTTRSTYDVTGNRTSVTDAEGRTTTYTYSARREVVAITTPEVAGPDGTPRRYTTTFAYDGESNRIRTTDNNGFTTEVAYTRDNLVRSQTDAIGQVTRFEYDANLNQVTIIAGAQLPELRRQILRFSYDAENQLVRRSDALGNVTLFAYDAPGNRARVTDANGNATDFEYDHNNRLVKEIRPAVIDPRTGVLTRYTVLHQYDANGNEIATTDENGHVAHFSFDRDNRMVMVEDANAIKTVFTYDSRHNRTSVQIGVQAHFDAATRHVVVDSTENAQVTTHTYDEFNQLIATTDGVGNALVTSDSPLYRELRKSFGAVDASGQGKTVAQLTDVEKQNLKERFTEHYTYDRVGNYTSTTEHLDRVTTFTYDALNRQTTRVRDQGGLNITTTFAYDGNGNRVKETNANGRATTYTYDGVNRLVDSTDPLGVVTHRDYDSFGNLTAQTRAAGTPEARITQYVYDLDNRLIQQTDPENHTETYAYDAVGNRLRVIDARLGRTEYVYDALNRNIKIIDPLLFETRFEYDGVGNRISLIDPRGGIQRLTYDAGNRLIQVEDAEHRKTTFAYDVRGNRITQTTGLTDSPATSVPETTTFEYDAQNNLRSVTDAEGNVTRHSYDQVYNRIETTDGNGHKTSYAFDALNRQITVTDAENGVTRFTYDAVGNRLTQTDALNRITRYDYDARNQLITQTAPDLVQTRFAYDKVGNRVDITRAFGTAEAQHTSFVYNKDDQLIATVDAIGNGLAESDSAEYRALRTELGFPAALSLLTDAQKAALRALHTSRNEYDENHNVKRTIDALGRATSYTYDADNRVTHITDPLGGVTEYRYDGNGNRVQVIDALGNKTTTYFNADNEAVLTVDAEGGMASLGYDANGNRILMTRFANPLTVAADPNVVPTPTPDAARDQTSHYLYDRVNRLTRTIDGEGYVADTQYDAVGNVVATKGYANKLVINPALPLAGQVPAPDPANDRLTQFQYDNVDRLVRRIDAEGFHTAYRYDAVGNRVEQTRFLDPVDFIDPLKRQVTGYQYDALNRLTIETSSLGVQTKHAYDLVGNRISTIEAFGLPEARTWQYAYDDLNRATSETNPEGTVTRFVYDAVGELRQKIEAAGLAEQRTTLNNYDANGRLTDRTNPDGTLTRYAYDALGNLKRQTDAADSADTRDTAYTYDRNSRLKTETVADGTPDAITRRYDYDAFGNRKVDTIGPDTLDARITRNDYDRVNHLVAQTDGNGIVTRFTYDTFGNVTRREITGQTLGLGGVPTTRTDATTFTYDGRDLLETQTNPAGDVVKRTYDGVGNLRFETRGFGTAAASVTEYRYDLGNRLTQKLVDPQGLALSTLYEYDALNNLRAETDANGGRSTSHYDVMNRVDQATDALGFTTSFGYDRFGNQTSITTGQYFGTDPQKAAVAMPATTRFEYDAMNRTKSQTDALGVITKYAYDGRGNRKQKIEAFGTIDQRTCTYSYDLVDRLVNETQPTGTVVHQAYNAAGELKSKTVDFGTGVQFKNATTRYAYDAGGRLASETDPVGSVTAYEYDSFGNRIRVKRGFGTPEQRTTELVYDGAQRLIQEIVDPTGLRLTTRYEYDARGNQTALVNANGQRGETVYDLGDRVVWQRDAEGNITRFIRDGRGNKKEEIHYARPGASLSLGQIPTLDALDRRVQFSYDANDRLTERIDARGVVNRLRYDAVGNVLENTQNATSLFGAGPRTTTYKYTLANLVREQVEPDGLKTTFEYDNVYNLKRKTAENRWIDTLNGNVERVELQVCEYQYDLNNRKIEELTDPGGLNLRRTWRYDGLGDRIEEIDANRNSTRTWFDAAGRAIFTVDPLGHVKEARYDAVGNLRFAIQYFNSVSTSGLTDPTPPAVVADPNNDRTVEYTYDKADRRIETKLDPVRVFVGGMWVDGHRPTSTDAYDGVGNVVRQTDANGNTTYHYFDGNGLEIGTIDAEGFLTVNKFDAVGNKRFETLYLDRQPLTAAQKETLDVRTYAPTGPSRVIEHVFDLGNNETETHYPSADLFIDGQNSTQAMRVERNFDALGQVLTETVMHAANDAAPAFKVMTYDAAGRIASEIDARAQELITSDDAYFVELRGGKLAAQLTEAEKQAFRAQFTTTYAYDSENNLREKVESSRVTTFEYDRANRNTRVHLPALDTTTVDASGNATTVAGVRPVAEIGYDAAGNRTREVRSDGSEILYLYDAANRQIASIDQANVYTEYGYDFAGNRTLMRRFFNPVANRAAPTRPAQHASDQLVQFEYDRAGRLVRETQEGDFATADDNRVTLTHYDANGNQVEIVDSRGFTSRLTYDGLNRIVGQQNPAGGITVTQYDAMGKVAARQVGGWSAPTITGGITETLVSNRGAIIAFVTDHATNAVVQVRRVGDTGAFTSFGDENARETGHAVKLGGLAADTLYEYQVIAKDSFGFTLTTATRTFRTGVGVEAAVLSNLRPVAGSTDFEADLHFALATPVQGLVVAVGRAGADVLSLANETLFTPAQQPDGSYSVTLRFSDPATAFFQIRWSVGANTFSTETSAVQQRQALRVFDGRVHAVSAGNGNFNLNVTWDLSQAFAANEIKSYIDPVTGQTRYNVYVGVSLNDAQTPTFVEARMPGNDGVFQVDFNNIVDAPRKLHFYYVQPDGSLVNAGPISVPTLNGLDQRHQRIELSFPDLDTTGATLVFRYRLQGTTQWNTLPASAVTGLSVNVLGLAEGNYEYQADLTRGGAILRTSEGSFKLREPGSVTNVVDAVGPNPVAFTVVDNLLSVAGLTPLGQGETLTLDVTDSHNITTRYPFGNASFDLTVLSPGDYSFRILKTRTATPPVVLNDITGNIHIAPLVLTAAAANALSSQRSLESFNRGPDAPPQTPTVTVTGTNETADHVYNFYDDLGWRTFSNENGGVWTRYFFDGAGNVTKEVRFRLRDYSDPLHPRFVDTIVDLDTAPTLARLTADYDAAVAAHNPAAGVDTIRVIEYTYDAANNKLTETAVSQAAGRVTDELRYDRFNNKIREVTAKGLIAQGQSLEQTTEYAYDSANRLTRTTVGPFQFFDSNGNGHFDTATTSITYDARGYKSTETTERGFVHRMHYDAQGRLVREWDAANTLRTDYAYDSFGRATQKTEFDITPGAGQFSPASRTSTLTYSNFDQITAYDFAGRLTRMEYDRGGNQISETNARGFTERYDYDAENHLVTRVDRLGNASFKSYDAYGHVISETDGNGRVTTYTVGAFGQIVSKQTTLTRGIQIGGAAAAPAISIGGSGLLARIIAVLQQAVAASGRNVQEGAASFTENTAYDWLGRTTQVSDSYGKNIQSGYDDADRLTSIFDGAKGQTATYAYDARGLRTHETLAQGASVLRDQINNYNSRGWLVGVDSGASVTFGGSTLSQPIHVFFRYDQAGNRVWVGDNKYAYDGDERMLMGFDGKSNQVVQAFQYDGYGNRTSITTGGSPVTYTYKAQGEVLSGSNGEVWSYDEVGNALSHSAPNGDSQTTTYDAENRAETVSSVSAGQTQNMHNFYDGAGNLAIVKNSAADFAFDEVTFRDVRYDEQRKGVENSWVNNAEGLRGQTIFTRNANGELVFLDRGRKKDAAENTVASFEYDNEDHIISRSDKPGAGTSASFFEGYAQDPDVAAQVDEFGFVQNAAEVARQQQLNGLASGTTHLQTFVYANGKPVAEASADAVLSLRKLTLQGGDPVTDGEGQVVGWTLTLQASDIVRRADGSVDRAATAHNIAARAYLGYDALSAGGKARVDQYVQGQLPTLDSAIVAGARISVFGFIQLIDSVEQNLQVRTDYSVKQIGQDGMPSGQVASYIVRLNDTLQSIATIYYGSPSYWYLIAGANGLSGSEQLREGTTLTIPNVPANNVNNSNTYKVYNEADIIGTTSPELVVIPKAQKKKKWYQKLVQVLIIVIVVVVAIWTAGVLGPILGAALGAIGTAVGVAATVAAIGTAIVTAAAVAAVGYAIGVATAFVTQGIAILAGLQEKFDWKAMQSMGKNFAVGAVSAGIGNWASAASAGAQASYLTQTAIRVTGEIGAQLVTNGKVDNKAGLLMALVPGTSEVSEGWKSTAKAIQDNKNAITAGLHLLEVSRKRDLNALDWANAAVQSFGRADMANNNGSINWAGVAQNALVTGLSSAYVSHHLGEEAGLNFLGNSLGRNVADFPGVMNRLNQTFSPITDLAASSTEYLRQLEFERNAAGILPDIATAPLQLVGPGGVPRLEQREAQRLLAFPANMGMTDVGPLWALPDKLGLPEDSITTGGAAQYAVASGNLAQMGGWDVPPGDDPTVAPADETAKAALGLTPGQIKEKLYRGMELLFTASQPGGEGLFGLLSAPDKETLLQLRAEAARELKEGFSALKENVDFSADSIVAGEEFQSKVGTKNRELPEVFDGTLELALHGDPTKLDQAKALGRGLQGIIKTSNATTMQLMAMLANSGDIDGVVNRLVDASSLEDNGVPAWNSFKQVPVEAALGIAAAALQGLLTLRLPKIPIQWGKGAQKQGAPFEDYLEKNAPPGTQRTPKNFDTFDFFNPETGVATSAKTLDTQTASRLSKPEQLYSKVKEYVDKANNFTEKSKGGLTLTSDMITSREVVVAVPPGTTALQWRQILRGIQYGEQQNVRVSVMRTR